MTKIKLCGLMRMEDVDMINTARVDYAGFVFASGRHRVTMDQAKTLKQHLHKDIQSVGVFVNEQLDVIQEICAQGIVDMVQLHGDEDELYLKKLQTRIKQPIIRAIRVQSKEQLYQADQLPCDYLLLDSYHIHAYGGSGRAFDHTLIPDLKKPFFLAGGLRIDTIDQAICSVHPYALDISSGVETEGRKDQRKIQAIVERIRTYE